MRLLSIVVVLGVNAYSITLDDIIANAKQPRLLEKALDAEELALESSSLANRETAPLVYNQSLSQNQGAGESGVEYEISFSKEFKLGNISSLEYKANQLNNQAYILEEKQKIYSYNNYLKNLYHNYCLDREYLNSFITGVEKFKQLYSKKEHAYREDEIAKMELLQLDLEKQRLDSELNSLMQKHKNAKEQLLGLTTLESSDEVFCQDIYPIVKDVIVDENSFSLTQEAYNKRIESRQIELKRYSQKIESFDVAMGYTKELDRDIYTISLSLPLNFSTKKSEYKRASILHQTSALTIQKDYKIQQKLSEVELLQKRLDESFQEIVAQDALVLNYTENLLPLIKKSYKYGESSVIEYLLSQQKLYTLQQELLEKKRGYYRTLFRLYSLRETKDI